VLSLARAGCAVETAVRPTLMDFDADFDVRAALAETFLAAAALLFAARGLTVPWSTACSDASAISRPKTDARSAWVSTLFDFAVVFPAVEGAARGGTCAGDQVLLVDAVHHAHGQRW